MSDQRRPWDYAFERPQVVAAFRFSDGTIRAISGVGEVDMEVHRVAPFSEPGDAVRFGARLTIDFLPGMQMGWDHMPDVPWDDVPRPPAAEIANIPKEIMP